MMKKNVYLFCTAFVVHCSILLSLSYSYSSQM